VGSPLYDAIWGSALRLTTSTHQLIDRISGGRLLRRFPGGAQVIWIETLGRRSGQWRRTPLLAVPTENGWGIAGSNAGQEKTPGWVFNVRAHNTGWATVDARRYPCTFNELHGQVATAIYQDLCNGWSGYRMYAQHIRREIPIFEITLSDVA
jgi:deazaflavin-dependent oxidoreductase (nitroreductase family)